MSVVAGELNWRRLSSRDESLIRQFRCDKPGGGELVDFIRRRALRDQAEHFTTTFVFHSNDAAQVDAYVTVSAASVVVDSDTRRDLRATSRYIPAVMIQFVAVAPHRDGDGLGFRIFEWLQPRVQRLNADVGVRFIVLGVRAAYWRLYRIYVEDWDMTPLPISKEGVDYDPPSALGPRPAWLTDDDMIHLYFDLVEHNGPYEHPDPPEARP